MKNPAFLAACLLAAGQAIAQQPAVPPAHEEALRCNTVYELGNIARMEHGEDKRLAKMVLGPQRLREKLWDRIIATNPEWKKLPPEEADAKMYAARDRHTGLNQAKYLDNLDLLVKDYDACEKAGFYGVGK